MEIKRIKTELTGPNWQDITFQLGGQIYKLLLKTDRSQIMPWGVADMTGRRVPHLNAEFIYEQLEPLTDEN
jgi:hypothetical protein